MTPQAETGGQLRIKKFNFITIILKSAMILTSIKGKSITSV